MSQGWVTKFERNVLFRISRFVAFSICFLLFISLLFGGLIYLVTSSGSGLAKPDPAEVVQSLKPVPAQPASTDGTVEEVAPDLSQSLLKGIKLPPGLQEFMLNPGNQQWLRSGLDELPEDQRQECVDGMAIAITTATQNKIADNEAADAYMASCKEYAMQLEVAKAAGNMRKLYIAGTLLSILVLIALFSLVLVLIAIERNTRQPAPAGAQS